MTEIECYTSPPDLFECYSLLRLRQKRRKTAPILALRRKFAATDLLQTACSVARGNLSRFPATQVDARGDPSSAFSWGRPGKRSQQSRHLERLGLVLRSGDGVISSGKRPRSANCSGKLTLSASRSPVGVQFGAVTGKKLDALGSWLGRSGAVERQMQNSADSKCAGTSDEWNNGT